LTLADRLDPSVQTAYRDLWEKTHAGRSAGSQEQ
jgi:hypothetical protein